MFLELENQRVIVMRTSQIMKYGKDVIIRKWTEISNMGSGTRCSR